MGDIVSIEKEAPAETSQGEPQEGVGCREELQKQHILIYSYMPGVNDDMPVVMAYYALRDEGALRDMYGSATQPTCSRFMAQMNKPGSKVFVPCRSSDGKGIDAPLGLVEFTRFWDVGEGEQACEVDLAFVKAASDGRLPVLVSQAIMKDAKEHGKVKIVTARTPSLNRASLLFLERLGFKRAGVMPGTDLYRGKGCDTVYSYKEL